MRSGIEPRDIAFVLLCAWLCVSGTPGESAARYAAQGCVSSISITSVIAHNGSGSPLFYVGDSINVRVKVTSACQIQSVVAEAFSATAPLSFNSSQNAWNGTLSIAGKPYGAFTLTATVTDINATAAASSISLFHDTPPVVTVTLPTHSAVARPGLHVTAACVDDAGACASFTVRRKDVTDILLSGSTHYDSDVSLSAYDGQEIPLDFKGTDSIGQSVTVTRVVYVESSPSLVEVAYSTEGRVLADSANYLLYVRGTDDSGIPVVRNKSTGVTTDLTGQLVEATVAFATDRGALAVHRTSTNPFNKLLEARDGVVSDLGGINGGTNLHASGNYAIWTNGTSGPLYRRDINAGSTITVNTGAGGVGNTEDDVAANGDVVYWSSNYQIHRVRDGVMTPLTSDGTVMNIYPVTDGINVAYQTRVANPSDPQNPTYTIRLITSGGDLLLGAWTSQPTPRLDYAVNHGWTAFTRQVGSSRNVWRRSPGGVESQITFFNDTSNINALNDDGRLVVRHAGRLWLAEPGRPLRDISLAVNGYGVTATARVRAFFRAGEVYVIIGASVFRLGAGPFTDPTLTAGVSMVRAVHVTELRTRIDAVRARLGLMGYPYTDPELGVGTTIGPAHFTDLRAALNQAYLAVGWTPPTYTDATLVSGEVVKLVHLTELRAALKWIE